MNETEPEFDPSRSACRDSIQSLQSLMDGIVTADHPAASAHRVVCLSCREEWLLAGMVIGLPRSPVVVPSGLLDRTTLAVADDSRRRRRQKWAALIAFPLAASVLVALFWPATPPVAPQNAASVEVVAVRPSTAIVSEPPAMMIDESITEAREALASISGKVAQVRPEMSITLPKPEPRIAAEPAWDRLADAGDGLKTGVRPLATSAKRAVNMLFKATETLSFAESPRKNRP